MSAWLFVRLTRFFLSETSGLFRVAIRLMLALAKSSHKQWAQLCLCIVSKIVLIDLRGCVAPSGTLFL